MSVKSLLSEEIQSELEELKKKEVGTEPYTKTVDGVTRLVDRLNEMEKIEIEKKEKEINREIDLDLRLTQMKDDRKERLIRNIIDTAGILLPLGVTVWGTYKSFKFEEEGTITTIMGRGFINKLLPKK